MSIRLLTLLTPLVFYTSGVFAKFYLPREVDARGAVRKIAAGHAQLVHDKHGDTRVQIVPPYSRPVVDQVARILYETMKEKTPLKYRQFKHVAGFYKEGLFIKTTKNRNADDNLSVVEGGADKKSVDLYIRYHLEKFLTDPQYKCKIPPTYHFFHNLFGYTPFKVECPGEFEISYTGMDSDDDQQTRVIDPARIYQIHYMRAGKINHDLYDNEHGVMDIVSKFGHAMARIVLCPPGVEVSEKCLLDTSNHVVVSFGGDVDGSFNPLKGFGIFGSYSMIMSFYNFDEVLENYSIEEDRKLYSLPLVLFDRSHWEQRSEAEKKQINENMTMFVHMAKQLIHYKEGYRFVNANCATAIANLLKASSPDAKVQSIEKRTPGGVLRAFFRQGLFAKNYLVYLDKNPERLEGPYIFTALTHNLQHSYRVMSEAMRSLGLNSLTSIMDLRGYVDLSHSKRHAIYERLKSKLPTPEEYNLLNANSKFALQQFYLEYFNMEYDLYLKSDEDESGKKYASADLIETAKDKFLEWKMQGRFQKQELKTNLNGYHRALAEFVENETDLIQHHHQHELASKILMDYLILVGIWTVGR